MAFFDKRPCCSFGSFQTDRFCQNSLTITAGSDVVVGFINMACVTKQSVQRKFDQASQSVHELTGMKGF